jgi:hypothetical protein
MAFDSTGFEPWPPRPKRSKAQVARERVLCVAVMILAAGVLILPVSAAGLIDLVDYLWKR